MQAAWRQHHADQAGKHHQRHHTRLQQRKIIARLRLVALRISGIEAGMAGLFALDRDTRIRQQSSPGAAKPPLAYLITGSFSSWWNGGGEDSVHSSVVAPSPHGLGSEARRVGEGGV